MVKDCENMIKIGLFLLLTATFATAMYDEKQFDELRKQYGWVDIPEVNMSIVSELKTFCR